MDPTLQTDGRASDVLCRQGVEKFHVFNVATDVEASEEAAERLRSAISSFVIPRSGFGRAATKSHRVARPGTEVASVRDRMHLAREERGDDEAGPRRLRLA